VKLDHDRLQKYLDEIAAETIDVESLLHQEPRKPIDIVGNPTVLKSLKYSTIVIAEAIASVLQHILAKKHNTVIDGYTSVFTKSKEHKVISTELMARLQPFIRFRNMLVHQYWRVDDNVFENNLRNGLNDFRLFVAEIKKNIREDREEAKEKD
jgi:uncharacterized protein YutE (UPF0331/DUF86 family)